MRGLVQASFLLIAAVLVQTSTAQQPIELQDVDTGKGEVLTIIKNKDFAVTVPLPLEVWEDVPADATELFWSTSVSGQQFENGTIAIDPSAPFDTLEAGTIKVSSGGTKTVEVFLAVNSGDLSGTLSRNYQAYGGGATLVPLIIILILAIWTRIVEVSLFTGIFVASCMIEGEIKRGWKNTLEIYILEALADVGHGYVYLFTLFLAGLVAMMEHSGGISGLTIHLAAIAKAPRSGQLAAFFSGLLIFFDDYANCLVIGQTMLPILDSLSVSREKLAFIVDATAAPIASLIPVSSWVGFEVGLIEDELVKIQERGLDLGSIESSGYGVFLQSIKYRYYPIFMICLQLFLILAARDFAFMLIAERRTQVYGRTDGGKGRDEGTEKLSSGNSPREDTPPRAYNMLLPVAALVFFIFYLLVQSGKDPSVDQSFNDIIQNSDSYVALLWGTFAAAMCTGCLYVVQFVKDDSIVPPPIVGWWRKYFKRTGEETPRVLMGVKETVESFLFGMTKIFPALIVLTLAWASGAVMEALGTDRFFAAWIVGGLNPANLPTLSFIISLLIASALGSSWGTMAILFPLITVPTFEASNGDPGIFYGTVAGILSGSVAGDHMSPISDTTVLSSLAAQCDLFRHVITQAPYVGFVCMWSIALGTLPVGHDAYSTGIGIMLGAIAILVSTFVVGVPVISPTGRFGVAQEIAMRFDKESPLHLLKKHTIKRYATGEPVDEDDLGDEDIEVNYHKSFIGAAKDWARGSHRKQLEEGVEKEDLAEAVAEGDKEKDIDAEEEAAKDLGAYDEEMSDDADVGAVAEESEGEEIGA